MSDGRGGLLFRNFNQVMRVDENAQVLWTQFMAVSSSYQFALDFALSPEGRIYIPFGDTRNQPWPQKDIYAQCLDLGGNYLWDPAGVLLARAPGDQWAPLLTLTENGFITCFNDTRSGYDDIYLQVVDSSGTALLGYAGAPLYINASDQDVYAVLPDGQGGAVAFWENWGVPEAVAYANHIMPDGRLGYPYKPQIVEPVTPWNSTTFWAVGSA